MHRLGLDDLRLFARLAALGSLSAVARERDVPVSQVSRALVRIEKACGARLAHRTTHALALTAEGRTFLAACQRVGAVVDELEGEFASGAGEPAGWVRVAASTVIAQHLLVPSLPSLAERHPKLRIDLEVGDRIVDMAREGIDIAIRTNVVPDAMVARRIGSLGRALYASPAYVQRAGLPRVPQELVGHALVGNSAATNLNDWPFVDADGSPLEIAAEGAWRSNDTAMTASMVLQGLGIGRIATLAAEPLVQAGRLVPVLAEAVDVRPVPIYAVVAPDRQRLPKIGACIAHWQAWFGADEAAPPGTSTA